MKAQVLALTALLATTSLQAVPLTRAEITAMFNDVKVLPEDATPRPASLRDAVSGRTGVKTGIDSRAELTFNDQSLARLGANTLFSFNNNTRDLTLSDGTILFRCPKNVGGAKVTTAAVTAAITGTTVLLETSRNRKTGKRNFIKLIVLEGTMRVFLNNRTGESQLIHAGQMIILNPNSKVLPEPVNIDMGRLVKTSKLITAFAPLPSTSLVRKEIERQIIERANGDLIETNLSIEGSTLFLPDLNDTLRNRDLAGPTPSSQPTPQANPTPAPTNTPTKSGGLIGTLIPCNPFTQTSGLLISSTGAITVNRGVIAGASSSANYDGPVTVNSSLSTRTGTAISMRGGSMAVSEISSIGSGDSFSNGIDLQSGGGRIDLAGGTISAAGVLTILNPFGVVALHGTTLNASQIDIAAQQFSLGQNYTFSSAQTVTLDIGTGGILGSGFNLLKVQTITSTGDINLGGLAVHDLIATGALKVGATGIGRDDSLSVDPTSTHTLTANTITSSGGIQFQGGVGSSGQGTGGGRLTLNVTNPANGVTFDSTGISGANLDGGDATATGQNGGNGGELTVNAVAGINVGVGGDILATTGASGTAGVLSGSGGGVTLTSGSGKVTVTGNILVSSNNSYSTDPTSASENRKSASGGRVTLKTALTSGVGITVNNTSQILALLNVSAPGPGGKIEFASAGANIVITGTGGNGNIQADKGTILIHNDGALTTSGSSAISGMVQLNGANLNADIIKVGALGVNGQLIVTAGSRITAGTLLNLYAGNGQSGHNDLVHFTGNGTIALTGNTINIGAGTVTVDGGTTVQNNGATTIYADHHNYSTYVTAGGGFTQPVTQQPLSGRPAF